MKFRTILTVGVSVAAGMVIANYLTNGAVMEAVTGVVAGVKNSISDNAGDVVDVITDTTESVVSSADAL